MLDARTHHDEFILNMASGGNGDSINMDDNDSNKAYTVCCCMLPSVDKVECKAGNNIIPNWLVFLLHSFAYLPMEYLIPYRIVALSLSNI